MATKKARIDLDASYETSRIAWDVVMRYLEQELCFNRDNDPACWKRHANFYGSNVQLYYWTNKQDKATYRWCFKIACNLSKAHYRIYRPKRDKMFYRLAPWKLTAFPDAFGTKCLLLLPVEYLIHRLQPSKLIDPEILKTIDPAYTSDIDYDLKSAYVDLASYVESARGFLPLDYKPHAYAYESTIRDFLITKLIFDMYIMSSPYQNLIQAIPTSVTSLSFGHDFRESVERGVLPECLQELSVTSLREYQEYHVPPGLRRLSVSLKKPHYRIPEAWTTQCFKGLPDQLEYMNLRNATIVCAGCPRCAAVDHAHAMIQPGDTTYIPSGLKTLLVCVRGILSAIRLYPCAIPEGVEHLALSIENGSRDTICFYGCKFPRLKTFLFYGQPCGIDQMIGNSRGLADLVVAFIHAPVNLMIDAHLNPPTQPPHASDMRRIGFDLALRMIAYAGLDNATFSANSIQMMRVCFTDAMRQNSSDVLVCASRSIIRFMIDNLPEEPFVSQRTQYVTPERIDAAEFRRKFVRVVRIVTGARIRGLRQDFLNDRGLDILRNTIGSTEPADVRPSLIALLAPEPMDPALKTPLLTSHNDNDDENNPF